MMQANKSNSISISEALTVKLKKVQADLEAGEKSVAARQSPLIIGLEAEIQALSTELTALDSQIRKLSDEYVAKKASIEQEASLQETHLRKAKILARIDLTKQYAKDKKLLDSLISLLDAVCEKTLNEESNKRLLKLKDILDEHESKLTLVFQKKADVCAKLSMLVTRRDEVQARAKLEVATFRRVAQEQTAALSQQEPDAGQGQESASIPKSRRAGRRHHRN